MKDAHLTLRLPDVLARALARSARERGVPKSHLAREAVARYLVPHATPLGERIVRAADLAKHWGTLPRLTVAEATDLAKELRRARKTLPRPTTAWE
jgi:hypothetical protein